MHQLKQNMEKRSLEIIGRIMLLLITQLVTKTWNKLKCRFLKASSKGPLSLIIFSRQLSFFYLRRDDYRQSVNCDCDIPGILSNLFPTIISNLVKIAKYTTERETINITTESAINALLLIWIIRIKMSMFKTTLSPSDC